MGEVSCSGTYDLHSICPIMNDNYNNTGNRSLGFEPNAINLLFLFSTCKFGFSKVLTNKVFKVNVDFGLKWSVCKKELVLT